MDSKNHCNEWVEEERNLLVFPLWQKGMQRAWMDEWLINSARNFLDSQKCVFVTMFAWELFVRYELWHTNLHLRLVWVKWTAHGQYIHARDVFSYVLIHHASKSAFSLLPLTNQSKLKSNKYCMWLNEPCHWSGRLWVFFSIFNCFTSCGKIRWDS